MARYCAPSTPSQTNRQSTRGPTAPRIHPTRGSRPYKAQSTHTTLQSTIAISAMTTTVWWSRTTQRLPTTKALTVAHLATTRSMPLWPSKLHPPLHARKRQRRSNMETIWPRIRGRPLLPLTTIARTWCMPSLLWPRPKASTSPWLSLWKAIDGTRQWTYFLIR